MDKKVHKAKLKAKRKEEILTASMEIFAKYGYHETDVEEIARLAGLGKGTVYRYFKSKENLFLSTLEWGLSTLRDQILEAWSKVDNCVDKVKTALVTYLQFFEKDRDFYRVLVQERIWTEVKSASQKWKERHLSHIHHLVKILKEGIEKGNFKKVDPESAAFALLGITNSILYKWLTSEKEYPINKEISIIEEIFFKGILKNPQNPPPAVKRRKEIR